MTTRLSNIEFFVLRRNQEFPAFIDVCSAIPPSGLDFRPHANSRSARELVALFVASERACLHLCETGRGSFASSLRWHAAPSPASLEEMIEQYKHCHYVLGQKLESFDDETWHRAAWLVGADNEMLLKDTVGGCLWIALFDAVHHRGQLSAYIRPSGGRVPNIYGPSGDRP